MKRFEKDIKTGQKSCDICTKSLTLRRYNYHSAPNCFIKPNFSSFAIENYIFFIQLKVIFNKKKKHSSKFQIFFCFLGNLCDWNTVHSYGLNYREEATLSGSVIYMQALCFL